MEPFTHTLVGVTLAQSGLRRWTSYAGAALLVGSLFPDVDAFANFFGSDTSLGFRRGWTHGIPALIVFSLATTGLLLFIDRSRAKSERAFPRAWPLLSLSLLAFFLHPALDWLNTYGTRWLMPWDGRWFYGDALVVVDPWIWLVLGGTVFLGHSRTRWGFVGWAVVAGLTTFLMMTVPSELLVAKIIWMAGLGILIGLRWWNPFREEARVRHLAVGALCLTSAYIGLMILSSFWGRSFVGDEMARQGIEI